MRWIFHCPATQWLRGIRINLCATLAQRRVSCVRRVAMRREMAGRNCFWHATDWSHRTDKLLSGWTMLTGGTHTRTHRHTQAPTVTHAPTNTDRHPHTLRQAPESLFTGIPSITYTSVKWIFHEVLSDTQRPPSHIRHLEFYCFISDTIPRTSRWCTIYCFCDDNVTTAFFTWKLRVKTL